MSGYLLDTNTLRVWFDPGHSQHKSVNTAFKELPEALPIYVSAITRGEVYFGHEFIGDDRFRKEYRSWIESEFPNELLVGKFTALIYGKVRAEICREYAPPGGWKEKAKRAEQLYDPVAGREIGIDENDLWLASQALERNLVLVTTDKMKRICEAIARIHDDDDVIATYSRFQIANWCKAKTP